VKCIIQQGHPMHKGQPDAIPPVKMMCACGCVFTASSVSDLETKTLRAILRGAYALCPCCEYPVDIPTRTKP
jgi:hypothetical protein